MPIITISSSFGSGGSVVAQGLATALGWLLLNRAITTQIAAKATIPLEVAEMHDERAATGWRRLIESFAWYSSNSPESMRDIDAITDKVSLRRATEEYLRSAASNNVVIVGRAAPIVLSDLSDALHVRLDGPREARIKQGAEGLGLTLHEAETRLDQTDGARAAYVSEMYRRDWRDPSLYHLLIDSTFFPLETCRILILTAARARFSIGSWPHLVGRISPATK